MPWSKPATRGNVIVAATFAALLSAGIQSVFVSLTVTKMVGRSDSDVAEIVRRLEAIDERSRDNAEGVRLCVQSLRARGAWMPMVSEELGIPVPDCGPLGVDE